MDVTVTSLATQDATKVMEDMQRHYDETALGYGARLCTKVLEKKVNDKNNKYADHTTDFVPLVVLSNGFMQPDLETWLCTRNRLAFKFAVALTKGRGRSKYRK